MSRTIRPFGGWTSPLTSELITAASVRLGELKLNRSDGRWVCGLIAGTSASDCSLLHLLLLFYSRTLRKRIHT